MCEHDPLAGACAPPEIVTFPMLVTMASILALAAVIAVAWSVVRRRRFDVASVSVAISLALAAAAWVAVALEEPASPPWWDARHTASLATALLAPATAWAYATLLGRRLGAGRA